MNRIVMGSEELAGLDDQVDELAAAVSAGVTVVAEPRGKAFLRALGIATPEGTVVDDADAAAAAAARLGGQVAVKAARAELAHKSDVGGVAGPLTGSDDVLEAARGIQQRLGGPILIERWLHAGVHCFLGLSLQSPYGPVVSFGLGGIWVEVLGDIAHRTAPLEPREASEMIRSLRGVPLLLGDRGQEPVDIDALAQAVARITGLARDPRVRRTLHTLEINPLVALPGTGPVALDCTLVLGRDEAPR